MPSSESSPEPPRRRRGRFVPMAPAPDPAATGAEPSRSRRRVYATRGLVASAAVLALAVQADQGDRTDDGAGEGSGDQTASAPVDPGSVDDA